MNKKDDKILRVCLCIFAVVLIVVFAKVRIDEYIEEGKREEAINEYRQAVSDNDYIMHALGGVDGHMYTNSKEALEESKSKNAKFYEVDVRRTSDGKLVLTKGWSEEDYVERIGVEYDPNNEVMSYDQFMGIKTQGKFTPIDFNYLVEFMRGNPDVYVMLDFGKKSASYLRKAYKEILASTDDTNILDHMIVGGQNTEMVGAVRSVYNFKIYNLYWPAEENRIDEKVDTKEEFLDYCQKNNISSLSTSVETYENEKETIKFFKENGLIVYVFTEDDEKKARELLNDVDMVGTNFILQ
ncbi:hypothetical protein IKF23_02590 [Candidatus Saccharibacteria bacterium]|nr:hypothetical protein [Candidatus Saccharibacteria bacterium]